jgi:hypothetical protein
MGLIMNAIVNALDNSTDRQAPPTPPISLSADGGSLYYGAVYLWSIFMLHK